MTEKESLISTTTVREFDQRYPKMLSLPRTLSWPLEEHRSLRHDGPLMAVWRSDRSSKGEDRLQHRHPARHSCSIRSKRSAIGRSVDLEKLSVEPQSLGRKKMPLDPAAILVGIAELPAHPRAAAVHHHRFRLDKVTHGELGAMIQCGCERKRAVGVEIVQPAYEVLP